MLKFKIAQLGIEDSSLGTDSLKHSSALVLADAVISAFDEAKNSKFIAFVLGLHGAALLGEGVGLLDAVVGGCVAVAA